MSLSQSLFSAISGLINHQSRLDNVGNNLANINTVGYKRNVLQFSDVLSQTLRAGSAPTGSVGGTNPMQIGLGMQVATVYQDFGQGGLQLTGRTSDLALEGDGFFKVVTGEKTCYTRDGSFFLDQDGKLVNTTGFRVQGWMADAIGNINTSGPTEDLIIALGERSLARATSNVDLTGNLNSAGAVSTTGTVLTAGLFSTSGNTAATGAEDIDTIYWDDGSGTPHPQLFAGLVDGDTITVSAVKGGRTVSGTVTYDATAGLSLNAFIGQIQDILGIQVGDGGGVSLAGGVLTVTGNAGDLNGLSQLRLSHAATTQNIFTETAAADGESASTAMVAYDSLGNSHLVNMTMALVSRTDNSSTWQWYADCDDNATSTAPNGDLRLGVGTGTVTFDSTGQFLSETGDDITIALAGTGVATPLVVDPDFSLITQLASSTGSELNVRSQDGAPMGTLNSYAIGDDGTISGTFTNGLTQALGRINVTRFANNNGLLRDSENLFREGIDSGLAQDGEAMTGGRGLIRAGTLESSNVDMAEEFTDMIVTQRGFQANARTITTSDQMLQELVNLIR